MEIWVPKAGIAEAPDRIEAVWEAWRRDSPKDECTGKLEGPENQFTYDELEDIGICCIIKLAR